MNDINANKMLESSVYLLLGNVDAGKSTLLGVLVNEELDNGNGSARSKIVKLKHERESGKTSTHSPHYIVTGNKITTIIDLCGHEKYMKTTMFGITGLYGDYGIVVIGANMGISGTTKEHIQMLLAMKIPFIIIITKIDLCQSTDMMNSLKKRLCRIASGCGKKTIHFFEEGQQLENNTYINEIHKKIIDNMENNNSDIIPIIMTSNKSGHNIDFIREFLTYLNNDTYKIRIGEKLRDPSISEPDNAHATMFLDSRFNVDGIGIVLSGTVKFGDLHLHQDIYIGPINNNYVKANIKTMKNKIGDNINTIYRDESGTIGIRLYDKKKYNINLFKKGQIVCTDINFALKYTCYSFVADIITFNTGTKIRNGYQCVLHCGTIRHTVQFNTNNNDIKPSKRTVIGMKFLGRSEFILPSTRLMFRDGLTKGFGKIIEVVNFRDDVRKEKKRNKKVTLRII